MDSNLANGYFVEPTIFANVNNDMTIAREGTFSLVASVVPFDIIDGTLLNKEGAWGNYRGNKRL